MRKHTCGRVSLDPIRHKIYFTVLNGDKISLKRSDKKPYYFGVTLKVVV